MQVQSLSQEDPLEKEMAPHSSVLAWRIPGMGETGGPPSVGSHRVGHDWSDLAAAAASILSWRNPWTKEPGGLQSVGSQESDTPEQLTLSSCIKILLSVFLWLLWRTESICLCCAVSLECDLWAYCGNTVDNKISKKAKAFPQSRKEI